MLGNSLVRHLVQSATLALLAAVITTPVAIAGSKLPVVLVSSSSHFDRACAHYYKKGNDPSVLPEFATEFCTCIAGNIESQGLDYEVLDFLARTYTEDLTTFADQYPQSRAWMDAYFAAEEQCKNADYGSNIPPPADGGNGDGGGGVVEGGSGDFPMAAGSWGGIVRAGPGRQYAKVGSLAEGERITLIENTGIITNDYPWFRIRYRGNREGYQWGGIICGLEGPIDGAFETCP